MWCRRQRRGTAATRGGPYGTAFKPSRTPGNRCGTRVLGSATGPECSFRGGPRGRRGSGAGRCGGYGTAFKPWSTAGATPVAPLRGRHARRPIPGRPLPPSTRRGTWHPSPDRCRAPRAARRTAASEPTEADRTRHPRGDAKLRGRRLTRDYRARFQRQRSNRATGAAPSRGRDAASMTWLVCTSSNLTACCSTTLERSTPHLEHRRPEPTIPEPAFGTTRAGLTRRARSGRCSVTGPPSRSPNRAQSRERSGAALHQCRPPDLAPVAAA